MPSIDSDIRMMAGHIRPDLISAAAHPEALSALLLANMMSGSLHEMACKAVKGKTEKSGHECDHVAQRIQKYVNSHFYHARPLEFAKAWGFHESERIDTQEDSADETLALSVLRPVLESRREQYEYVRDLLRLLDNGTFPNFIYSNVDMILAHGQRLQSLPSHPLGLSTCLDECLLIASLAVAGGLCALEDIALIGSPFHYTLFLFRGDAGWWFNAKRDIFTPEDFSAVCQDTGKTGRQDAFDLRIVAVDRLIAADGYTLFGHGRSSLPHGRLSSILERISRFLGVHPKQLAVDTISEWTSEESPSLLDGLADCHGASAFAAALENCARRGNALAASARCAFRLRGAAPLDAYVAASMKGYRVYLQSALAGNLEEALSMVRSIPGREPVFADLGRIALPDEVLLFQTASPDERILLLHTLLLFSPFFEEDPDAGLRIVDDDGQWTLVNGEFRITGAEL